MDLTELPFNKLIGLNSEAGSVTLSPLSQHANHVETVRATVIYGVAEAASGQRLVEEFPDLESLGFIVLRSSTVKFRRPASLDLPLVGVGAIAKDDALRFRSRYETRRRSTIDVSVVVTQGDAEILAGAFS